MNMRQKKKHFKYRILHMNPGEVLVIKNDNISEESKYQFLKQVKGILPKECAVAFLPEYKISTLKLLESLKSYDEV